uniref:Uncharacterized protein n=1 Tax=Theropithecus gelada TaxID=9565 RepID=A0A8D2FAX4_THEGE
MVTSNPSPQKYESDDDSYEVLDLTEYARRHQRWNRVFGRSWRPMIGMCGVTGWYAGFLLPKVGKLAATAVTSRLTGRELKEMYTKQKDILKNFVTSSGFVGGFLLRLAF